MALDFPNSPTLNQTFTGPNGTIWMWDSVKWAAITSTTTYAGQGNVGRNVIHNPLFNVIQRGAGPFTTNVYTLDRWINEIATDTLSITSSVISDGGRSQIGDEVATNCLQATFTGNAAAGAFSGIEQRIEKVFRLSGKTVTVSFWAIASAVGLKLGNNIFQIFGSGGSPSAATTVLATGNAVTLTTGWARYSFTATIPSAAGKSLGTNGDDSTWLRFFFSSGATNNAAAGNIGVQSGTIQLWGVQLEVGSVATPLEKPDPRYDLDNCCRFFQIRTAHGLISATAASQFVAANPQFSPTMRATPTLVVGAAVAGVADADIGGINVDGITASGCRVWAGSLGAGQAQFGRLVTCSADL